MISSGIVLTKINVNPGWINPKRLFNWEGTISVLDYSILLLLEEYPPNL